MYSVKEAARIMEISERHLRLLLENGQVMGKKLGHDWVVLEVKYKRKRRLKKMTQYTLKFRCPVLGDIIEGVVHEAGSVYQARSAGLNCPHHEDEIMEVVEVASSEDGILWQDPMWLREDKQIAREIDSWGKKVR